MKKEGRAKPFHAALKGLRAVRLTPGEQKPAPPVAQARAPVAAAEVDDATLFAQAVGPTQPLRGQKTRLAAPERERQKRLCDEQLALAELQNLVDGSGAFRISESEEFYSGLAPGVNFALLAQLRAGNFAFHSHLDLHGFSRDAGHQELIRFIVAARRSDERCVLVVTGRGKSSPMGISVLRDAMPRWLSRAPLRPHVLAFCSAQAVDGGPGAFYVLLRRAGVAPFGVA